MTTLAPDDPAWDKPDSTTEAQMAKWGNDTLERVLNENHPPLTWGGIKALADQERIVRLRYLAQKSHSELIPNVEDHKEMDYLLDPYVTAKHDLLAMTAGRSPLSVKYDSMEA